MLVSGFYQIVDGIFIGNFVGSAGLAAINAAWPWIRLITGIGLMIGMGAGIHCSISQGENRLPLARQFVTQALWLLILLGLSVGCAVIVWGEYLLQIQGIEITVLREGQKYLQVFGWSCPLIMASLALPILVRNLGSPLPATLMMVVGAVVNVVLDYIFIVVMDLGLEGAAWATVIGESLSALIGGAFLFSRFNPLVLNSDRKCHWPQIAFCSRILISGFSSLLIYLYASFAVILHNGALMRHGETVHVAAYAITGYIMTVYYLLAEGLANAMQPIVSHFHGPDKRLPFRKSSGSCCS